MELKDIYKESIDISDINNIEDIIKGYAIEIGKNSASRTGLYTVLVTLLYYKHLYPKQDIRYHQAKMKKGFSGRSFDTKYVSPVLKELGLPSMNESGWTTRSMEQSVPYDLKYTGAIGKLKMPFLNVVDYVEKNPKTAYNLLRIVLHEANIVSEETKVAISPLSNPDGLTIEKIIKALTEHFLEKYNTHGGAKLPVLAFHSIYKCLIDEFKRYENCELAPLSSLTACDKTNKASGDIEIYKDKKVFESIEIKLDRKINSQILRIAEGKIYRFNPQRYYILSVDGIEENDKEEIEEIVDSVLEKHGCQIIINGLIPTLKYYLRLIINLDTFVKYYSDAIEKDGELQKIHKDKWNELLEKYEF